MVPAPFRFDVVLSLATLAMLIRPRHPVLCLEGPILDIHTCAPSAGEQAPKSCGTPTGIPTWQTRQGSGSNVRALKL